MSSEDEDLEALRQILLGHYQQRAQDLEHELSRVQDQITSITLRIEDKQALIDTVTPIMANSIRKSIHDSKDEMVEALYPVMASSIQQSIDESKDQMVEALYPIVGRLVTRSVSEAMRDLARRIDDQMRNTFSPEVISRRIRAQISGVSHAELTMRSLLPFQVRRIFLIDRETGILLNYLSATGESADDSDIIGSMLTAIRDFVQDAFGRGEEGELDAIRYGDRTILIETAKHAYVAVVTSGIVPAGYHATMRQQLFEIEERYGKALRGFDGDTSALAESTRYLQPLIPVSSEAERAKNAKAETTSAQQQLSRAAAWLIVAVTIALVLLAWWIYRSASGA